MSVINYAHRGASEYYPENTLWAFYAGLEMQANGIETDIQSTSDGVLVLHHDETLERVAGKTGKVRDYTYLQLLSMDFGAFMGERFVGEKIVTLDTFLSHFGNKNLKLALELKQFGLEAQTINCIERYGCRDKVVITSFIWESLESVRKLDPTIAVGYLTNEITSETLDKLEILHIGQVCPHIDKVNESSMELARKRGFSVRFWGIKDEASMYRALELKGDGMTINFPDKLFAALKIDNIRTY